MSDIASEGLILVSSSTERGSNDGGQSDGGTKQDIAADRAPRVRKRRAAAKDEEHVSQALRTVYQRAVDEAIPSEMLDLLSKLG